MLFSVEQAFVGRDERWAPVKIPVCEANPLSVKKDNYVINPDLSFVFNVGNTAVTTVERPETR